MEPKDNHTTGRLSRVWKTIVDAATKVTHISKPIVLIIEILSLSAVAAHLAQASVVIQIGA